jgi:glycosyltransferase involved in cell wall biosynthesis
MSLRATASSAASRRATPALLEHGRLTSPPAAAPESWTGLVMRSAWAERPRSPPNWVHRHGPTCERQCPDLGEGTRRLVSRHRIDRENRWHLGVDCWMSYTSPEQAYGRDGQKPLITAVVAAYNAEQWIGETLTAILSQTHPPDEVIVIDDGSTDGTADELGLFGSEIRVVTQANGGCPAAFNRGFGEARGDYVAMCGADDVWEPYKLEWQVTALASHPEIDIAFGGARIFGSFDGFFKRPPGEGLLDAHRFLQTLYRGNIICASSVLVRRRLYHRLGPFVERCGEERFACDDYDYWIRALAANAVFFYDRRVLVGYRRHTGNATNNPLFMYRSQYLMHRWHADKVDDARLVRAMLARDMFSIARGEIDAGERLRARASFIDSLRLKVMPRALAFVFVLLLPERPAQRLVDVLVASKHLLARIIARSRGRAQQVLRSSRVSKGEQAT